MRSLHLTPLLEMHNAQEFKEEKRQYKILIINAIPVPQAKLRVHPTRDDTSTSRAGDMSDASHPLCVAHSGCVQRAQLSSCEKKNIQFQDKGTAEKRANENFMVDLWTGLACTQHGLRRQSPPRHSRCQHSCITWVDLTVQPVCLIINAVTSTTSAALVPK